VGAFPFRLNLEGGPTSPTSRSWTTEFTRKNPQERYIRSFTTTHHVRVRKLRKDVIEEAPEIITSFSPFSDLSQKLLDSPESIKVFLS
jgi:hypothetical protein